MELGNFIFGNSRGDIQVNRDWEEDFHYLLEDIGFTSYGYIDTKKLKPWEQTDKDGSKYFENDLIIVRPYYWGEDDEVAEKPNFVFKPRQFEMSWYKYPLRDAYMNQELTKEEFLDILKEIKKSFLE